MRWQRGGKVAGNEEKPIEIADPFARQLVGQYLQNRKADIKKLKVALSKADFEAIRTTGHNLYGSGAAYGIDDISFIGASIEKAADSSDADRIEQLIGELCDLLKRLKVL